MEITELTAGLIVLAFICGAGLSWILKKPTRVSVESPHHQREKTLIEAQHEALLEDMQSHLNKTKELLDELTLRQEAFSASLRGERSIEPELGNGESDQPILPPRDYSDTRGQLNN